MSEQDEYRYDYLVFTEYEQDKMWVWLLNEYEQNAYEQKDYEYDD